MDNRVGSCARLPVGLDALRQSRGGVRVEDYSVVYLGVADKFVRFAKVI